MKIYKLILANKIQHICSWCNSKFDINNQSTNNSSSEESEILDIDSISHGICPKCFDKEIERF